MHFQVEATPTIQACLIQNRLQLYESFVRFRLCQPYMCFLFAKEFELHIEDVPILWPVISTCPTLAKIDKQ